VPGTTTLNSCALIALGAAIAACQSAPTAPADTSGKAIVRAYGGGTANWLAVTFKPVGEAHDITLNTVNGDEAKHYGNDRQILLAPGHYEIAVRCTFTIDNQPHFFEGKVKADVLADHRYLIDSHLPAHASQGCPAEISDAPSDPHQP
jgi:hypothetical protein